MDRVLLRMQAMGSITKAKSNGNRGHPCLVLLPNANRLESKLPERILATSSTYNSCTKEIKRGPKPILLKTAHKNPHSTLSKALALLRERIAVEPAQPELSCRFRYRRPLWIYLALIPTWSSRITSVISMPSLPAKTLARTLISTGRIFP